ncbi:cytochrome o ubiquinol oxidase subunit IV [Acetobacteraceae bacterium ESL0709]|nr:cytochrome o ubiquinol oxidase subunit IV [Acetobacteraceae bacterium ESL0697]MDF7677830.1 cytochrome o ubiquinol oxidase subunit IV [Acetobacteraceae bacterium ESL0709]
MSQNHATSAAGESHGSYGSYITGFVLAVILTVASFAVVLSKALSFWSTLVVIGVLAAIQMVVHMVFFLHMNGSSKQRWILMTFLVTAFSVFTIVVLSLFVLWDTQMHMMSR